MGCASSFKLLPGWLSGAATHFTKRNRIKSRWRHGDATLASGTNGILSTNLASPRSVPQTCRAKPVYSVGSMWPVTSLPRSCGSAKVRLLSSTTISSTRQAIAGPTCSFARLLEGVPFPEPTLWASIASKGPSDAYESPCFSVASGAPSQQAISHGCRNGCEDKRGAGKRLP